MTNLGNVSRLFFMFDHGSQFLKYPKIRTKVDTHAVCLYLAGNTSKYPGAIQVTNGGRNPNREWFGRIMPNGGFVASQSCPSYVCDFLEDLVDDPVKIATQYGQLTGMCFFVDVN